MGRRMDAKCMIKNMRCVTHGCAVVKSKTRKQHWEYIDRKASFGWKYRQVTKLICTGLGGISETEIGCSSSGTKFGDFGLAEGGLNSAQNNEELEARVWTVRCYWWPGMTR